ncbi:MAG: TIGR03618 family F420-dependent PPOX class oxidoreductase [Streptosporangiaceae bacterium]
MNFAVLATQNADGTVHQCVMWYAEDGKNLVMASKRYRRQCRNIAANPRVSVLIHDRDAPERYVHVQGTATLAADGARDLIERLSLAYTGRPHGNPEDHERIVIRVTPETVTIR